MTTFEQHIEAYLEGELHGEAKRAFLLEVERDPEKQKMLTEHQRLNAMMKDNARIAAVPLQTQRALAERIPVLKDMNPRLAPLSGAEVATQVAGGSTASTIGSSLVVKAIRIVSILGVAAVGSWYGITQFSGPDEATVVAALNDPVPEIEQPLLEEQAGVTEMAAETNGLSNSDLQSQGTSPTRAESTVSRVVRPSRERFTERSASSHQDVLSGTTSSGAVKNEIVESSLIEQADAQYDGAVSSEKEDQTPGVSIALQPRETDTPLKDVAPVSGKPG